MTALPISARALCEALAAAHVTLDAPGGLRLIAHPRAAVSPELATLLRRFKPELIGAIRRGIRVQLGPEIAPCRGCDLEFVHVSERYCPWCNVAEVGREFVSTVHTLDSVPVDRHPENLSPRVPTMAKTCSGDTGGHLGHL